jgi:hypothetical protein
MYKKICNSFPAKAASSTLLFHVSQLRSWSMLFKTSEIDSWSSCSSCLINETALTAPAVPRMKLPQLLQLPQEWYYPNCSGCPKNETLSTAPADPRMKLP